MEYIKLFLTELLGLVDVFAQPFNVFPCFPENFYIFQVSEASNLYPAGVGST
jgi:hypothetical protein